MIKNDPRKSAGGTSFHGQKFSATVEQLKKAVGLPCYEDNSGKDKTNFDWTLTVNDKVFTIYDWKYYRPIKKDELVVWHIGAHDAAVAMEALEEITELLNSK